MVGDGSFLMMAQEIVTAVQEQIKLTIVLVQNHGFASIGALSESLGSQRFGTSYRGRDGEVLPVDLAAVAAGLGADVHRATTIDEFEAALREAAASPRITVVEVQTDPLVERARLRGVVGRPGRRGGRAGVHPRRARDVRAEQAHAAAVRHMSVGVGVIGAGMMGAAHVATLTTAVEGAHVAAVSDADPARADAAARDGGARAIADPHELIADPAVDAVVVASFDTTHEEFVLACIAAGKPVLCEKPLATTADACLRVIDAEVAAGRRFVSLGFMRRYDPAYAEIKASLDDGGVGAVLLAHCAHRNAVAPAVYTSEMLITSSAVHEIDVMRWLLGEEIVGRDRARAAPDQPGARRACATRSSCCWRPRAAC